MSETNLNAGSNRPGARPDDLPHMLTAKELEKFLKIDVKTIYSYVRRGLIPYVRIQSNVRFLRRQILEWIADQSYRPHSTGASSGRKSFREMHNPHHNRSLS